MSFHDRSSAVIDEATATPRTKTKDCEAIVVGAGPYGLSAAAHLKAIGVDVKIFGRPMEFWARQMPAGMLLRSPRVASNISDPARKFTLDDFELSKGVRPMAPVPLETFVDYGQWFQLQLSAELDQRNIAKVCRTADGFSVTVENGEEFHSRRVIVATGIGPFRSIPPEFASLPPSHASHCYEGCDVRGFSGKRVAVIGAGQSALETGALLHEAGANVEIIARIPALRWIGQHPWLHKMGPLSSMLYSSHDIGPAGVSRLVAAPNLVRRIPLKWRDKIRKRAVRSAGSRWLPERLKQVKISLGRSVTSAAMAGQFAELKLDDGSTRRVDHVVLGTGYSVEISKYTFLPPELVGSLDLMDGYPKLTSGFCSSVPGLHFIGATAARSYGPLLYFVAGTEFASKELASYVGSHRLVRR